MNREELLKAISCEPSTMAKVEKVLEKYSVGKDDLTTEGREHIAEHNFALPGEKKYPIHDISHARNALARSSGKPEEQKVKSAVYSKYPSLKPEEHVGKDTNNEGPLDERAQAALKAVVRILSPFKDSLSPLLLHEVLDAAGIQMQSAVEQGDNDMGKMQKGATMSPEPIESEHEMEFATKIAKVFKEHMTKLGYQKYPEQQIAQKAVNTDPDEPGQDEEQEGTMHNPDVEKSAVAKADLAGLPEGAKRAMEAVFKANADLRSELDAVKRVGLRKDLIQKAQKEYANLGLPPEEIADMLLDLKGSPKALERVEKMLSTANNQAASGSLFAEFGSSNPGGFIGSTWEAIEKAAQGFVAKSGDTMTKEQATAKFLETSDGKRMYDQYLQTHASRK